LAAVVPLADLELLEALEDRVDLEAVQEALAEPAGQRSVPWEALKAKFGL